MFGISMLRWLRPGFALGSGMEPFAGPKSRMRFVVPGALFHFEDKGWLFGPRGLPLKVLNTPGQHKLNVGEGS